MKRTLIALLLILFAFTAMVPALQTWAKDHHASRLEGPSVGAQEAVSRLEGPSVGAQEAASRLERPTVSAQEAASRLEGPSVGAQEAASRLERPTVGALVAESTRRAGTAAAAHLAAHLAAKTPKKANGQKQTEDIDKNEKNDKNDQKPKKIPPIYKDYVANPSKLGFSPDEALFRKVLFYLKNFYVDPVPEKNMCEGLLEEMKILLRDAKLPDKGLAELKSVEDLSELFEKVLAAYEKKVNRNVLVYACIQGMIGGTKDPHSVLMTPKDYDFMMERLQNKDFSGIGIYIEKDKNNGNYLTVIEPIEGTPAYKAGLQPGDAIIKVEGKDTSNMTMEECVALIRGPMNTAVKIIVQKKGGVQKEYVIKRATIHVPSVKFTMEKDNVGYVRLRTFGVDSGTEVGNAVDELKKKGAKALILDLRNNTGGYITAAVDVSSHFLPEGSMVVYTVDRNSAKREMNVHMSTKLDLPLVVLMNEYSASASEITAGALKDHKAATLIGTKTFGKGSVQQPFPLTGGAVLKLTIAHFYTPLGNKIDGKGVTPEVEVKQDPKEVGKTKDVQLKKAIEYIKKNILK